MSSLPPVSLDLDLPRFANTSERGFARFFERFVEVAELLPLVRTPEQEFDEVLPTLARLLGKEGSKDPLSAVTKFCLMSKKLGLTTELRRTPAVGAAYLATTAAGFELVTRPHRSALAGVARQLLLLQVEDGAQACRPATELLGALAATAEGLTAPEYLLLLLQRGTAPRDELALALAGLLPATIALQCQREYLRLLPGVPLALEAGLTELAAFAAEERDAELGRRRASLLPRVRKGTPSDARLTQGILDRLNAHGPEATAKWLLGELVARAIESQVDFCDTELRYLCEVNAVEDKDGRYLITPHGRQLLTLVPTRLYSSDAYPLALCRGDEFDEYTLPPEVLSQTRLDWVRRLPLQRERLSEQLRAPVVRDQGASYELLAVSGVISLCEPHPDWDPLDLNTVFRIDARGEARAVRAAAGGRGDGYLRTKSGADYLIEATCLDSVSQTAAELEPITRHVRGLCRAIKRDATVVYVAPSVSPLVVQLALSRVYDEALPGRTMAVVPFTSDQLARLVAAGAAFEPLVAQLAAAFVGASSAPANQTQAAARQYLQTVEEAVNAATTP